MARILSQTMLWAGLCFPDGWLRLVERLPGNRYRLDPTVPLTGRGWRRLLPSTDSCRGAGGGGPAYRPPLAEAALCKKLQFHSTSHFPLHICIRSLITDRSLCSFFSGQKARLICSPIYTFSFLFTSIAFSSSMTAPDWANIPITGVLYRCAQSVN